LFAVASAPVAIKTLGPGYRSIAAMAVGSNRFAGIVLFGNGSLEYSDCILLVVAGSKMAVENRPLRCAEVGTVLVRTTPVFSRAPCQSTKKNVLFFRSGPPRVKPY
jgi:hypothetical protein